MEDEGIEQIPRSIERTGNDQKTEERVTCRHSGRRAERHQIVDLRAFRASKAFLVPSSAPAPISRESPPSMGMQGGGQQGGPPPGPGCAINAPINGATSRKQRSRRRSDTFIVERQAEKEAKYRTIPAI